MTRLPEPAATQLNRLQLRAALDSLPPVPRDLADRIIARANAMRATRPPRPSSEYSEAMTDYILTGEYTPSVADVNHALAMQATRDLDARYWMPITERLCGDVPRVDSRPHSHSRPHGADGQRLTRRILARLPVIIAYAAIVAAVIIGGNAYLKWGAANGHRQLLEPARTEAK